MEHVAKDCIAEGRCWLCKSNKHPGALHPDSEPPQQTGPSPPSTQEPQRATKAHLGVAASVDGRAECGDSPPHRSWNQIYLANIYPDGRPEEAVKMCVMVPNQSDRSLARSTFFDLFDVQKEEVNFMISMCTGSRSPVGRKATGLCIESLDGTSSFSPPPSGMGYQTTAARLQYQSFKKNFGCGTSKEEKRKSEQAYSIIKSEYRALGRMKFSEAAVLILFIALVVLWFTREPGFMPGWANALFSQRAKSHITDATVVIFIALLMFLIPSELPRCSSGAQQEGSPGQIRAPPALLDWTTVNRQMPWNIVILLGGGFALAKGSEVSGLSSWLGNKLTPLQNIPHPAITFLLCLLVAVFTECTSNVATTTLFLPILASMAQAIELNPLYVMLPCTLAASLAFMLPVATPPNAIVFSYGNLRVIDMVKAGFMLNILGVLTIMLAINTWGVPMFNLRQFPAWAHVNATRC
ncbi:solute carrier family 13 member 2 [Pseudonaja textilis]|uniref:solute carrier family 13 member 2 n=1 Tax=Pseudonaja textilis TaxID=8673 RepID=UPI000EA975F4|nr:solute carrier family 13 member 2 [Pseudonaja textilis]